MLTENELFFIVVEIINNDILLALKVAVERRSSYARLFRNICNAYFPVLVCAH